MTENLSKTNVLDGLHADCTLNPEVNTYESHVDYEVYRNRVHKLGLTVVFTGLSIVLLSLVFEKYFLGFLVAAMLCGMAETHGRCGVSHVGMIAPFWVNKRKTWMKCCLAYSIGGIFTSYMVGLTVAGIGSLLTFFTASAFFWLVFCIVCSLFFLREVGILQFRVTQCNRQTFKIWAHRFGMVTGAGMWGAHIGLAVSTVITHSGLYCILLVILGMGLGLGELTLVCFWLGRIIFLWTMPMFMNSTTQGKTFGVVVEQCTGVFRFTSLCGIAIMFALGVATIYAKLV